MHFHFLLDRINRSISETISTILHWQACSLRNVNFYNAFPSISVNWISINFLFLFLLGIKSLIYTGNIYRSNLYQLIIVILDTDYIKVRNNPNIFQTKKIFHQDIYMCLTRVKRVKVFQRLCTLYGLLWSGIFTQDALICPAFQKHNIRFASN